MTPIERLAQVPMFRSLEDHELQELAGACRPRTFKRGEVLFHEDDPSNVLYILRSGEVKLLLVADDGEETILHVVRTGECLGELSLVDAQPRSATAVALDRVEALALLREDFLALVERRPAVAHAVMIALAGMVRRLSAQVQDVMTLDVAARLAKKLLELAERHGEGTPEGIRIALRLKQQELAEMIGATRVSVNQHLGWFQEQGILSSDADGFILHKPEQLRRRIY
jgi:CRP/FNR family transcriptional regulator/CRP/FNR family cyclic AMP-dependent transcriptional regulator